MQICPNCGCNLERSGPTEFGNVTISDLDEIIYEGQKIVLPRCQHNIVSSLVRARGRSLTCGVLAECVGGDIFNSTIVKYVERTRRSLKSVNPAFDQIEAIRGFGAYRWSLRQQYE